MSSEIQFIAANALGDGKNAAEALAKAVKDVQNWSGAWNGEPVSPRVTANLAQIAADFTDGDDSLLHLCHLQPVAFEHVLGAQECAARVAWMQLYAPVALPSDTSVLMLSVLASIDHRNYFYKDD